jgi:hypothetical protein
MQLAELKKATVVNVSQQSRISPEIYTTASGTQPQPYLNEQL